jgi:hypothetical protein
MTRHTLPYAFIAAACLCLLTGCVLPTSLWCDGCRARPPKAENLTGVWIGFDESQLDFCRLDLRPDATGFFATVSPADTSLHDYGVQAYRVTHWAVDEWKFTFSLSPATTNAEPIYLRGRGGYTSLDLEIGGTTNQWKRKIVLYPETRIDGANRETRDKIGELEKR